MALRKKAGLDQSFHLKSRIRYDPFSKYRRQVQKGGKIPVLNYFSQSHPSPFNLPLNRETGHASEFLTTYMFAVSNEGILYVYLCTASVHSLLSLFNPPILWTVSDLRVASDSSGFFSEMKTANGPKIPSAVDCPSVLPNFESKKQ